VARVVQTNQSMHSPAGPPTAPSLGDSFGRALDLAQRVAVDEVRLLQIESHERLSAVMRRAAWIGFGAFCLAVAWIGAWAAAFVALEDRFSLEARLALLAISQCVLGASLLAHALRGRADAP